jgi:hypothetical protein
MSMDTPIFDPCGAMKPGHLASMAASPETVTALLKEAMNALLQACSVEYPRLPQAVLLAYHDPEHRKFDAVLWLSYLNGLLDAIAGNPVPYRVQKAAQTVLMVKKMQAKKVQL